MKNSEKLLAQTTSYFEKEYYKSVFDTLGWFEDLFNFYKVPTAEQVKMIGNWQMFEISSPARTIYTKFFGFPIFSKEVIDELIYHIDGRKCLEVCAGSGWLSKLLRDNGANIVATDLGTWEARPSFSAWKRDKYIEMDMIDAIEVINKYSDVEIVIMSWPEYESPLANLVLNKCLETGKELIYIGEDQGGCTADDSFFETLYEKDLKMEPISDHYISFDGIHDDIYAINNK